MSDIRKSIGWADWSWNPVWGCLNKCPYCYARNIAKRFGKQICGRDDFKPVWVENNFSKPFPKYASHIFVNSMSDIMLWEKEWWEKVFEKTRLYPDVKFLFLTKGNGSYCIPINCYIGKTVTKDTEIDSLNDNYDFYSIEPIHEKINVRNISKRTKQIIVGAETGNRKGKIIPKAEWIEEIREYCQSNGIKLFEKDSLKKIVNRPLIQERI